MNMKMKLAGALLGTLLLSTSAFAAGSKDATVHAKKHVKHAKHAKHAKKHSMKTEK